jgi:uncharacterized protein YuzB (UPF0349 family)
MKITFCQYNKKGEDVINLLKKSFPEHEAAVTRCIYSCGDCADKFIARIDGTLLTGETAVELAEKISTFKKL